MTDEEIIETIGRCCDVNCTCEGCAYEKQKVCWKKLREDVSNRFNYLKAENAALKERLDKAVELPFLIQDGEEIIVVYKDKDNYIKWYRWIEYKTYGEYGNGKEVAEARLKELQGGNI